MPVDTGMKPIEVLEAVNELRAGFGKPAIPMEFLIGDLPLEAADPHPADDDSELPIPSRSYYNRNPSPWSSWRAFQWHLAQRETNGMDDMNAVVEQRCRPGARASLKLYPSRMDAWVAKSGVRGVAA